MTDLGGLTRRDFCKLALLTTADLAIEPSAYSAAVAQQNPRNVFSRGIPYNIESQKPIELEQSKRPYILSTEEQETVHKELSKIPNISNLPNIKKRLLESYSVNSVKIEPDYAYAQALAKEAEISIAHLFNFLNSTHLQKPAIEMIIPREKNNIRFKGHKETPLYLVADLGDIIVTDFEFYVGGIKQTNWLKQSKRVSGLTYTFLTINKINNEFKVEKDMDFPIFYNTSGDLVHLIDTPAIEALHYAFQKHTFKNLQRELAAKRGISEQEIINLERKYTIQEEKAVHAICRFWLETKYNHYRGLGLTNEELIKRFEEYETVPIFKGTNTLARHISQIGVQRAIELYVNKPDELFKVLRN